MTLHIESIGRGHPLVLLHGWGMHSGIWHSLLPELTKHYQIILVDLPGFGRSSHVLLDFEENLNELADKLPAKFSLLGWSLGGLIATSFALRYPERVSHLINVCSSPKFVAQDNWPGMSQSVFGQFESKLRQDFRQTLRDFLSLQLTKSQRGHYKALLDLLVEHPPHELALHTGLTWLSTLDLRTELELLAMPCLFIYGRLDAIVSAQQMQAMQQAMPHFTYKLYPKCAHLPFLTNQANFEQDLLFFLENEVAV